MHELTNQPEYTKKKKRKKKKNPLVIITKVLAKHGFS